MHTDRQHRKKCSLCRVDKDPADFPVNAARYDGLANYCVECNRERQANAARAGRIALLEFLGGKCVRCGFTDWRALQIDHVNGDGAQERREGKGPSRLARWVKANPERFQVLCANCNSIKRIEDFEHMGKRIYTRAVLTERVVRPRVPTAKAQSYDQARTRASEQRQAELVALVEKRRPERRSLHALPYSSWSRWYEECLGCEETARKHSSDGLCWRCNKMAKGLNRGKSVYASLTPVG